jgi:hypothetical protein
MFQGMYFSCLMSLCYSIWYVGGFVRRFGLRIGFRHSSPFPLLLGFRSPPFENVESLYGCLVGAYGSSGLGFNYSESGGVFTY